MWTADEQALQRWRLRHGLVSAGRAFERMCSSRTCATLGGFNGVHHFKVAIQAYYSGLLVSVAAQRCNRGLRSGFTSKVYIQVSSSVIREGVQLCGI